MAINSVGFVVFSSGKSSVGFLFDFFGGISGSKFLGKGREGVPVRCGVIQYPKTSFVRFSRLCFSRRGMFPVRGVNRGHCAACCERATCWYNNEIWKEVAGLGSWGMRYSRVW